MSSTRRVYIVDDDVDLVDTMTAGLAARGFTVKSQYDDERLVDNIREFNPDVIVLDVMFPGDEGAGFAMARTIRHHDDIKRKPIIMLSAVNTEGHFAGRFSNKDIDDVYLPITAFLDKPVDPAVLAARIEKLTR